MISSMSAAGRNPGHLRQTLCSMEVSLSSPGRPDIRQLDDCLRDLFCLDLEPGRFSRPIAGLAEETPAIQLVWRGMLLGRQFLQAAAIPVFDPGIVMEAARSPDQDLWRVRYAVPNIQNVDVDCYRIAYGRAIKLVEQLGTRELADENPELLRENIQKAVINPLRRKVASGKSTLPVLRAAYEMDLPFIHLGAGVYQLGWGANARKIDRSIADNDSALGCRLAQNKEYTARILRLAGLPAPIHVVIGTADAAVKAANKLGWPVVVKPADSDRGEGVTVGVRDDGQLQKAFEGAVKASRTRRVIVEREVPGVCHRLFIAAGKLLYAVKRLPKSVVGDGRHSVAELIAIGNRAERARPPWLREEFYPDDELAMASLKAAGFTLDSIPGHGVSAPLRAIESTVDGGLDEEVTDRIHPDTLEIALQAAELFNLSVAGVDIITSDISVPWQETGAIINEVNFSPLLGGAEISRRYVPEFLRRLVVGDGRIPVDVFLGGEDAMAAATARQRELVAAGKRCYLTTHVSTLAPGGEAVAVAAQGLNGRCRALLLNRSVESIVLVIQTDELLGAGTPVDSIQSLSIHASNRVPTLPPEKLRRLARMLRGLLARNR